jgi:hypothetical protein
VIEHFLNIDRGADSEQDASIAEAFLKSGSSAATEISSSGSFTSQTMTRGMR